MPQTPPSATAAGTAAATPSPAAGAVGTAGSSSTGVAGTTSVGTTGSSTSAGTASASTAGFATAGASAATAAGSASIGTYRLSGYDVSALRGKRVRIVGSLAEPSPTGVSSANALRTGPREFRGTERSTRQRELPTAVIFDLTPGQLASRPTAAHASALILPSARGRIVDANRVINLVPFRRPFGIFRKLQKYSIQRVDLDGAPPESYTFARRFSSHL